jgi:hypothetical protein
MSVRSEDPAIQDMLPVSAQSYRWETALAVDPDDLGALRIVRTFNAGK